MKQFIITNWYKLMTASAMLVFALSFFVFVIKNNVAKAGVPNTPPAAPSPSNTWMVVKGNTVYEVTWDRFTNSFKCEPVCNGL